MKYFLKLCVEMTRNALQEDALNYRTVQLCVQADTQLKPFLIDGFLSYF